jgi:Tol biopolymer transport system component
MHIWTLPIEGGKPTQLTNASAPLADQFPCWSPDGKAVAFVRSRNSQDISKRFTEADIFIVPAAGGEPKQLTTESDKVAFGSVAWSPDGKLLACLSGDVRVIPAEGGQSRAVTKLSQGFEVNIELAWSPDSRRIAFNDYPGGGIKIVSLDDGQLVDVNTGVPTTRLYHLDWSPDGEKLVFAGQQGGVPEFWMIENFPAVGMGVKESK